MTTSVAARQRREVETPVPVAHIDDVESMVSLQLQLRALHGEQNEFSRLEWRDRMSVYASPGRVTYNFVVRAENAQILLVAGDRVRGAPAQGSYGADDDGCRRVTTGHSEALWPGDVFVLGPEAGDLVALAGCGVAFQVVVEESGYRSPRLALLRNLSDKPGGCAAYPGAFRREALPPDRRALSDLDQRGVNRVNEHTLDMRVDRTPTPIRHCHGPLPAGDGKLVNHSEIAIILSRTVYGLPEVGQADQGHLVIHPNPAHDPGYRVTIPITPGSIVVTPATREYSMGHCFENAFAMLIAIPGFVAPYNVIELP